MATPDGARNWKRRVAVAAAAVLALAASTLIIYRVLAPAEVVTPALVDYPSVPAPRTGVVGTLNAAPLIVDDRLRLYATTRQVSADQPVNASTRRTPYWSYRRWPAELTGVVAAGTTVVSRWSDGELIALDARTGRVRWRTDGPRPERGYVGRRTGAATVYAPDGLHTAPTPTGTLLVVAASGARRGIDLDTGREIWRTDTDPDCVGDTTLTTGAGRFVTVDRCAGEIEFHDAATGARITGWRPDGAGQPIEVTPLGCGPANSGCRAIRTSGPAGTRGWLIDGDRPVAAPALDAPDSVPVDDIAVRPEGNDIVATPLAGGTQRWRWSEAAGPARILAVQPGRVHLRTTDGDLVTLEAATGAQRSRFRLTYGWDSLDWSPGFAYASGGYLAVERLAEPVDPAAGDDRYYLAAQPVILAAT